MNQIIAPTELEMFNRLHGDDDRPYEAMPEYKLKITRFANSTLRAVLYKVNLKAQEAFTGIQSLHPRTKTDEEKEQARLESIERATRRAKQAVHHLVRSIGADHMLTLTTRENITCHDKFDALFKRFIRLVREKDLVGNRLVTRSIKRDWAYVAVKEHQNKFIETTGRNALHFHIACVGKQDIKHLRACWYVALGGLPTDTGENTLGQIDVQADKKRFSGRTETFKTFKLVGYLTKYITDSFLDNTQLGMRRYRASSNIPRPVISRQYIHAYFSYGEKPFIDAFNELTRIAEMQGVNVKALDYELTNMGRGQDLLIMDAPVYDWTPF